MIVSRSNLQAVHVTRADAGVPMLDNVMIAADGSTCGTSGRSIVIISPVKKEIKEKLKTILKNTSSDKDILISADTAREILKTLMSDRKYGGLLEHCNIEAVGSEEVKITLTDGKRSKTIHGRRYTRPYLPYQHVVRKAFDGAKENSVRVAVNMKRMLHLLETIQKICPDSAGESPLFMEFSNDGEIIIRAVNFVNTQRAIGIMTAYQGAEGKWLDYDEWEKEFLDSAKYDKDTGATRYVVKSKKVAEVKHRKK